MFKKFKRGTVRPWKEPHLRGPKPWAAGLTPAVTSFVTLVGDPLKAHDGAWDHRISLRLGADGPARRGPLILEAGNAKVPEILPERQAIHL